MREVNLERIFHAESEFSAEKIFHRQKWPFLLQFCFFHCKINENRCYCMEVFEHEK